MDRLLGHRAQLWGSSSAGPAVPCPSRRGCSGSKEPRQRRALRNTTCAGLLRGRRRTSADQCEAEYKLYELLQQLYHFLIKWLRVRVYGLTGRVLLTGFATRFIGDAACVVYTTPGGVPFLALPLQVTAAQTQQHTAARLKDGPHGVHLQKRKGRRAV